MDSPLEVIVTLVRVKTAVYTFAVWIAKNIGPHLRHYRANKDSQKKCFFLQMHQYTFKFTLKIAIPTNELEMDFSKKKSSLYVKSIYFTFLSGVLKSLRESSKKKDSLMHMVHLYLDVSLLYDVTKLSGRWPCRCIHHTLI